MMGLRPGAQVMVDGRAIEALYLVNSLPKGKEVWLCKLLFVDRDNVEQVIDSRHTYTALHSQQKPSWYLRTRCAGAS